MKLRGAISSVGRYLIIINQKLCNLHKWLGERMRGIDDALRLIQEEKHDEARLIRREISEKRMEKSVRIIPASAWLRNETGAGLCRDAPVLQSVRAAKERLI